MPTRPLPLLRALLRALDIPLDPPTLHSIPPSLLILVLESILHAQIPLPSEIRKCADEASELELVKILLGVLADDELGMDMTIVDPLRVVRGMELEMSVVIMALVVVAKRRGIAVGVPETEEGQRDLLGDEEEEMMPGSQEGSSWERPLLPDISWSALPAQSRHGNKDNKGEDLFLDPTAGGGRRTALDESLDADSSGLEFDPYLTPVKYDSAHGVDQEEQQDPIPHLRWDMTREEQSARNTTTSTTRRRRTVLQDMMDEFGLG